MKEEPSRAAAQEALRALLAELPMEFAYAHPDDREPRHTFTVIKQRNVAAVHRALWTLRQHLDVNDDMNGRWIEVEIPPGCTREDVENAARFLLAHTELIERIAREGTIPDDAQEQYDNAPALHDLLARAAQSPTVTRAREREESQRVVALYEYEHLFAVYADTAEGRAAAEADADQLRAQARADWDDGHYRVYRDYVEPRLEIHEVAVHTTPRSEHAALAVATSPGWRPLLQQTLAALRAAIPGYAVRGVKPKRGSLQVDFEPPAEASPTRLAEANRIVADVAEASRNVCQECGEAAEVVEVRHRGWLAALCPTHRAAAARDAFYDQIEQEYGLLTSEEVDAGLRDGTAAEARAARRIVAVEHEGRLVFPGWQFNSDGEPLAVIEKLVGEAARVGRSERGLIEWVSAPSAYLGGDTPAAHLIGAPELVVAAARSAWGVEW